MASAWSTTPGSNIDKTDARLSAALEKAAKSFAEKNPGYRVEGFSGKRPRSTTKNHPRGLAIDVNIYDPSGKKLGNVKNAATFGIYESLAHEFRAAMDEAGLKDIGRWGGYFQQGVAFDQMHFDLGPRDAMAYGTWENGLNEAGKKALPGAKSLGFKAFMDAMFGGLNPKPDPNLPDTMQAPRSLADVRAQEAIASAYNSPTRALDVSIPASQLAGQYSQYQRGTVPALSRPSAPPSNFSVPARPSPIGSAPVGQVTRAPLGPALSRPTPPSNFAGGTTPAALNAAPAGTVTRGTLAPAISRPSAPPSNFAKGTMPTAPAKAAGTPTAGYDAKAQPAGTPTAGYDTKAPSTEKLAANYGQYRTPTNYTNVQKAMQAQPMSLEDQKLAAAYTQYGLTTALAPTAPVTAPPAIAAPPAQVLAPALVPRPPVNDLPVASIPAAPQARAYDVYSGMAETAMDNTNRNQIGTLPGGGTTVTNQYGATTGMTPGGYQTAVGSLPGISGPVGQAVKGAVPTMAGGLAGGLLGGPRGALIGATLVKEIAKPGGLLSKQNNFNTDWFGNIVTNKAIGGLGFPSAPSAPAGARNVRGFDSASDRSHAYGISPGAAAAIDKGLGGLY